MPNSALALTNGTPGSFTFTVLAPVSIATPATALTSLTGTMKGNDGKSYVLELTLASS